MRLENVTFTYPGAAAPALEALDMAMAAGTTIAGAMTRSAMRVQAASPG